ncbi:MAG: hypothetical protein O2820_01740 [Planctomycetota bacterium]|nr:hypothetical protein [Planctomycetota bacterium]MDA1247919.1 hypothetical protein [Planctomycetota bacterium]
MTSIQLPLLLIIVLLQASLASAQLPVEPLDIGHEPQFLFDGHIVDNHWAIRYKRQAVTRVFHQATKHGEPVLKGDQPSFLWVVRDDQAGLFRMYYQANFRSDVADADAGRKYTTRIAYAESKDGVEWTRPDLGLFAFHKTKPNNVVIAREGQPDFEAAGPVILEVPEEDRRGFRWLMLYRAKGRGLGEASGIHVAGSNDGVRWKPEDDQVIAHLHSDHHNTISWDPLRHEFVMFCRAKHIYRAFGEEMLDTGASRRVARFTSPKLWTDWMAQEDRWPQTVLVPDEIDSEKHFNFFYGMPTVHRHGVYWGFLEPFRMNDFIQTELAVSRDGVHFTRFADRPPIIPYGKEGSWDDEMIFASPGWVEVGDEWWIYYSGWDGPHGTTDRTGAIGLAKIRKEGFVSMRGPAGGGVVCTRVLRWPGGDLIVNADCGDEGVLRVRISEPGRKPIASLNYDDCEEFRGNSVSHQVKWKDASISALKDKLVRLEFYLQNADLYTFRAAVVDSRKGKR